MQVLFFFVLVFGAVGVLAYSLKKTSRSATTELSREQREKRQAKRLRLDQVAPPGNNLLCHNDEFWKARRKHVSLVTESSDITTGQRHFKYRKDAEPEYDGYSRADRHRLTPGRIKEEGRIEDIEV